MHIDLDGGVADGIAALASRVGKGGQVVLHLRLAHHAALALEQQLQHRELARRQLQRLAIDEHAAVVAGQPQAAQAHVALGRGLAMLAAAQQHAHARFQLGQREGLDEVVVGAGVEAGQLVFEFVAGGKDDDRRGAVAGAVAGQQRHAVDAGQAQVEDDEVVLLAQQVIRGIHAVMDHAYLVAGAGQARLHATGDLTVVLDQQDTHGRGLGGVVGQCRRLYRAAPRAAFQLPFSGQQLSIA
ncbi:hypothetical protein D3C86_1444310 [compost metagenome]